MYSKSCIYIIYIYMHVSSYNVYCTCSISLLLLNAQVFSLWMWKMMIYGFSTFYPLCYIYICSIRFLLGKLLLSCSCNFHIYLQQIISPSKRVLYFLRGRQLVISGNIQWLVDMIEFCHFLKEFLSEVLVAKNR